MRTASPRSSWAMPSGSGGGRPRCGDGRLGGFPDPFAIRPASRRGSVASSSTAVATGSVAGNERRLWTECAHRTRQGRPASCGSRNRQRRSRCCGAGTRPAGAGTPGRARPAFLARPPGGCDRRPAGRPQGHGQVADPQRPPATADDTRRRTLAMTPNDNLEARLRETSRSPRSGRRTEGTPRARHASAEFSSAAELAAGRPVGPGGRCSPGDSSRSRDRDRPHGFPAQYRRARPLEVHQPSGRHPHRHPTCTWPGSSSPCRSG